MIKETKEQDNKTLELFESIKNVLDIVTQEELINHINEIKKDKTYFCSFQDKICSTIVQESCIAIGITKHDLLNTRYNFNGKRVMAYAISAFVIKSYFQGLSFLYISQRYLNNKISPPNLSKYIKMCENINETIPTDIFIKDVLIKVNLKIKKIYELEKINNHE
jgi:hypothetical protein